MLRNIRTKLSNCWNICSIAVLFCFVFIPTPLLAEEKPSLEIPITKNTSLRFATKKEAAAALAKKDIYIKSMSSWDRKMRAKTEKKVSVESYIEQAQKQVQPWTAIDQKKVRIVAEKLKKYLEDYDLPLPKKILLIKTSGKLESGAAYCREANIILPQRMINTTPPALLRLITHELFHVLSNHNAKLRDELYKIVGFERCNLVELPKSLQGRKITNPDAPVVEHYLTLKNRDGKKIKVVPVLISKTDKYDTTTNKSLFSYMQFFLMQVEKKKDRYQPYLKDGQPVLHNSRDLPSYFDHIGRNTGYIIHPEEVLADNFVHLLAKKKKLPTPKIIEDMEKILKSKKKLEGKKGESPKPAATKPK